MEIGFRKCVGTLEYFVARLTATKAVISRWWFFNDLKKKQWSHAFIQWGHEH